MFCKVVFLTLLYNCKTKRKTMLFLRFSALLHTCPFGHVLFLHRRTQQSGRVTHRQSIRIYRSTNFLGPLSSAYPIRRAHSPQLFPSRYRSRSPRPVHPGQTDSQRRKSPRSACGAAPPAQTVLFLLPVHRPDFPPVSICLLSLCRAAPPAAQISRLASVTVTRFRALRPLREYKQ